MSSNGTSKRFLRFHTSPLTKSGSKSGDSINRLRDILLDAPRWRLDGWHYDKLCIVFEGQGWALDGRPFDHIDGEMLMNLDQESSKCLRMCSSMCRKELETRLDAFDTPAVKRIRERWTLPNVDVCAPVRPFEVSRAVGQADANTGVLELDTRIERECSVHPLRKHVFRRRG